MSSPGILYVTGTLTVPVFVPFSAVNLANTSSVTSPTVTVASFGNLSFGTAFTASWALAFANSFSLSGVVPLATVTSPFATGNTVTGTVTFSGSFIPA